MVHPSETVQPLETLQAASMGERGIAGFRIDIVGEAGFDRRDDIPVEEVLSETRASFRT